MSRRRAFTLVELLVSIAIIAMLIAILLPSLHKAKEIGRKSLCQNNLRQVVIGWSTYPSDHDNEIVNGMPNDSTGWVRTGSGHAAIKGGKLFPYINTTQVFRCQSDESTNERSYSIVAPMRGEKWNQHLTQPGDSWIQVGTDDFASILYPSQQMVLLEELDTRGWNVGSWIMYARQSRKYQWIDYMAVFHGDGTSISFADGHVEYWYWQDKDTLYAGHNHQFYLNDWGNADWLRVRSAYRVLASYPDVPEKMTP